MRRERKKRNKKQRRQLRGSKDRVKLLVKRLLKRKLLGLWLKRKRKSKE